LTNYLRPRILDDLGLLATIRWYRQASLQRHPDIAAAVHLNATEMDIPARLKLPIYRVFQEAVDNIVGHDRLVNRIEFRLTRQLQTVQLEIYADGSPTGAGSQPAYFRRLTYESLRHVQNPRSYLYLSYVSLVSISLSKDIGECNSENTVNTLL
jgi:signal transduction histidine kinase